MDFPGGRYLNGEEVAQAIVGRLKKVGITVKMTKFEYGSFVARWKQKKFKDMAYLGSLNAMADPDQVLSSRIMTGGPYGYYANPQVDELIKKARIATGKERAEIYSDIQKIMKRECPVVALYQKADVYGINKEFIDWAPIYNQIIYADTVKVIH